MPVCLKKRNQNWGSIITVYKNMDGAQGETRTLTISLPADFESAASTIPPLGLNIRKIFLLALRFLPIKKSIVSYKNK